MKTRLTPMNIAIMMLATGTMFALAAKAAPIEVLTPAADTFISAANQTTNYGSNTKVNIEDSGTSGFTKDRIGFFRFDLSTYGGGTIAGAIFTLFPFEQISSSPQDFDVYGIPDGGSSENFIESGTGGLTWTNSGYGYTSGNVIDSSGLDFVGTITGVTDADEGGSVDLSSAALDTFLNNDGNNIATFIVVNTNGTGSFNGFYSKENTNSDGATLTIVPEPSSAAAIFVLGTLASIARPRKRHA